MIGPSPSGTPPPNPEPLLPSIATHSFHREAAENPGLSQLIAVRSLLSPERRAKECDILLSTAFEALLTGDKSTEELLGYVIEVWPGAGIDQSRLETALQGALAAGYISPTQRFEGVAWELTPMAKTDMEGSKDWAAETLRRAELQLQERAQQALRPINDTEAHLWLGIVCNALFAGIKAAHAVHQGSVELLRDRSLLPRSYDSVTMFGVIEKSVARPEVRDFLRAMVVSALDSSDPFGNELVTYIATGYILHAFLARRDLVKAHRTMGSMRGHFAFLDTPILLRLLDNGAPGRATEHAILAAVKAGVQVIAADHVFDELQDVIGRLERDYSQAIEESLAQGSSPSLLQNTVDEPIIATWLGGVASGRFRNWRDFRAAAIGLRDRLKDMGVARWIGDQKRDGQRMAACSKELTRVLQERGRQERGRLQIDRDAQTMAMAWLVRLRASRAQSRWPRSLVITTDLHMAPAYKRLSTGDPFPLTVTTSEWIGLLSAASQPAGLEDLAESAATLIAQETMLAVAVKYPPAIALDIAKALAGDGRPPYTDLRAAQFSLEELVKSQPDLADDPQGAGVRIAALLLASRNQRMAKAYEARRNILAAEEARLKSASEQSARIVEEERKQRQKAQEQILEKAKLVDDLQQELGRARERERLTKISSKRRGRVRVALVVILLAAFIALAMELYWLGVGTLISAAVLWARSGEWIDHEEASWKTLVVAGLPELLGVMEFFHSFSQL